MTNKFLLILLVFLVGISVVWLIFGRSLFTCTGMSCVSFVGQQDFRIQTINEHTSGIYRAIYIRQSEYLRLDVRADVAGETSADYIHGRVAGMKALYDNIRSPYPGMISNEIVCDSAFKPTYASVKTPAGLEIQEIFGYLNGRMTFGSCQKEEAKYRGMMLLFACIKQNRFYQLEFIAPVDLFSQEKFESLASSIQCR